jgi:hypothetical protein
MSNKNILAMNTWTLPPMPTPPPNAFLERLIRFLMPFFLTITPDLDAARAEILETLASYGAQTRAEMLNAVQVIAFGFSALDVLAEAKATEMSPAMRLRFRGCANNLNRACQQNEKTLAQRQASSQQDAAQTAAEPIEDIPDTEVQAALQQAKAQIATSRARLSSHRPTIAPQPPGSTPQEDRNTRLWTKAMMDAVAKHSPTTGQPAPT